METPYKAISFEKHDVVTRPVLDQLNANYRWILENTPRGRFYRDNAEPRPENINMIAGKAVIKQNNTTSPRATSVGASPSSGVVAAQATYPPPVRPNTKVPLTTTIRHVGLGHS